MYYINNMRELTELTFIWLWCHETCLHTGSRRRIPLISLIFTRSPQLLTLAGAETSLSMCAASAAGAGGTRSYNFKIVLLGEGCVGKTSLVLRYVEDKFNDRHITTLQASFLTKRINLSGKRVNLAIWDTAGQERFHALGPIYYRESHGAILVYDITDEDSFQKVKNWVRELRRMLGNDICLVIAGNKIDMEKERHVSLEEAEAYAQEVGAFHFQTSAKQNKGVEELFIELTRRMLDNAVTNDQQRINSLTRGGNTRNLQIIDDQANLPSQKSSCCSA